MLNDRDNPNRHLYNVNYSDDNVTLMTKGKSAYDVEIIRMRLELLQKYGAGKRVMDLCCGTGSYLRLDEDWFSEAVGIDFSSNMLSIYRDKLDGQIPENLLLIEADARQTGIASESIDFVFSYTSLYHVPQAEQAIQEIGRVLAPGGYAVFELGNLWSLNTYVCNVANRRDGTAKPFHMAYGRMRQEIEAAGLQILEQRVFQILPMWGPGIPWMLPITTGLWKHVLGVKVGGRMLDEWISSAWPLRMFAFRHLFVVQKC